MSLCRPGSLTKFVRELARYKLGLVDIQGVRCDKGGTVRAGDYIFSMVKKTKIIKWEWGLYTHRIISTVKSVEFVSDRMSYTVLKGRWCKSIVFNVHAPIEENSEYSKALFIRN